MKLIVSTRQETPIYEQLYTQIVAEIINKNILPDQCLPSIRVVARELAISVVPVKAAYDLLEQNGYIYTVPGKGCFVSDVGNIKTTDITKEKMQETVNLCKKMGMSCDDITNLAKECYQQK